MCLSSRRKRTPAMSGEMSGLVLLRACDHAAAAWLARMGKPMRSIEALRRRLQALAAVARDPGATEHERATAAALKARLERRLKAIGSPTGDWTDGAFRLGRWARTIG